MDNVIKSGQVSTGNLDEHVHPNDLRKATNLYSCCFSCLEKARLEMHRDNLDEALRWTVEFQRCKKELDELMERKKLKDRMEETVRSLQEKGYNVDLIAWKGRKEHA